MSLLLTGAQRPPSKERESTPPILFQEMLPTRVKSHLTWFLAIVSFGCDSQK